MCYCQHCNTEYNIKGYKCEDIKHICSKQKEPNIAQKVLNLSKAAIKQAANGTKRVSQEIIDERYNKCSSNVCGFFRQTESGGVCKHGSCGCNLNTQPIVLNKLAWSTQECPVGEWHSIE